MAGLLFYFPQAQGGDVRKWFAGAGLGELLRDDDALPAQVDAPVLKGPDGGTGRLAFWDDKHDSSPLAAIEPTKQTWLESPACAGRERGAFWIGYWNDKPPTPAELLRKQVPIGVEIELGRYRWRVAVARELPQAFGLDAEGESIWIYEEAEHQAYFDEAMRLLDVMFGGLEQSGGETMPWNYGEHLAFAFRSLALSYRVTPEVLALMKALRRDGLYRVALAAAGIPLDFDQAKKTGADTTVGA